MSSLTFESIDWSSWQAQEQATLCFVIRDGQILLIRKKRGLGKGKINGPGGRLERGETPLHCAVREVEEELGVVPVQPRQGGELSFQFVDGYSLHVHVFSAEDCRGQARESEEAVPLWTSLGEIPYDQMWEDDRLWLPHLLAGTPFRGRFLFSDDRMLGHELDLE